MSFWISPFDSFLRKATSPKSSAPLIPQGQSKESAGVPINSDSALYFGDYNSNANLTNLILNYEIMDSNGGINLGNLTMIPETDRTGKATSVKIGAYAGGRLISAAVIGNGTLSRRGQTYVFLYLLKGSVLNTNVVQLLIADYIDKTNFTPCFPGPLRSSTEGPGYIYNALPASPAVGQEILITVPTNTRWKVRTLYFKLVTSSQVASRQYNGLVLKDAAGNEIWFEKAILTGITATTTQTFVYNPGTSQAGGATVTSSSYVAGSSTISYLPAPDNGGLILSAGYQIKSSTSTFQNLDQYTIQSLEVEEWIVV